MPFNQNGNSLCQIGLTMTPVVPSSGAHAFVYSPHLECGCNLWLDSNLSNVGWGVCYENTWGEGIAFQAKGRVSMKSMRWEHACCVQGMAWRPVRPEWNERWRSGGPDCQPQGMRWGHEKAEGKRGTESWSFLLYRPKLLFSELAPLRLVAPPVSGPPRGPGRKQSFSTTFSTSANAVGAVHGSDVKHGLQDTKKRLDPLWRLITAA